MKRLAPSGPSVCLPAGESGASAAGWAEAGAYACGNDAKTHDTARVSNRELLLQNFQHEENKFFYILFHYIKYS